MKAIRNIAIIIIVVSFYASCSPGDDNKAASQKVTQDSLAQAQQDARDLNQSLQAKLAEMTNRMTTLRADLDTAKQQIVELNECHFWLTKAECEKQAHDQSI